MCFKEISWMWWKAVGNFVVDLIVSSLRRKNYVLTVRNGALHIQAHIMWQTESSGDSYPYRIHNIHMSCSCLYARVDIKLGNKSRRWWLSLWIHTSPLPQIHSCHSHLMQLTSVLQQLFASGLGSIVPVQIAENRDVNTSKSKMHQSLSAKSKNKLSPYHRQSSHLDLIPCLQIRKNL